MFSVGILKNTEDINNAQTLNDDMENCNENALLSQKNWSEDPLNLTICYWLSSESKLWNYCQTALFSEATYLGLFLSHPPNIRRKEKYQKFAALPVIKKSAQNLNFIVIVVK